MGLYNPRNKITDRRRRSRKVVACASTDLRVICNDLTITSLYELILLDRLHYFIGELFPKYQSGAKRTCLIIVRLRQLQAVTACSIAGLLFQCRRSAYMLQLLLTLCQYDCVICKSDVCDILSIDVYSLSILQCFSYQVFRVNVEQTR